MWGHVLCVNMAYIQRKAITIHLIFVSSDRAGCEAYIPPSREVKEKLSLEKTPHSYHKFDITLGCTHSSTQLYTRKENNNWHREKIYKYTGYDVYPERDLEEKPGVNI